jgi:hypothetical protein
LYRSTGVQRLFALNGVERARDRTYHWPDLENRNVVRAIPAASAVTVRWDTSAQVEPVLPVLQKKE